MKAPSYIKRFFILFVLDCGGQNGGLPLTSENHIKSGVAFCMRQFPQVIPLYVEGVSVCTPVTPLPPLSTHIGYSRPTGLSITLAFVVLAK